MNREMKHSGIAWIGEVPNVWTIDTIGNLYTQRNEKVSDKDYPPLSVGKMGVVPQLATAAKTDDGDNRKLVKVGDFAINSRSDRRGSCGISSYDGSVSLINTIITPRTEMNPQYYNWLFHTELFADEFYKWGHGIVDDLWTTRWQEMKRIAIVVPPLAEQKAIADFLDKKCNEIDELVALQEKMIEELKAYKQSVITEAVCKGLNPNVPMKDSGVEWVGNIPSDWQIHRVKRIVESFSKGEGITKEEVFNDGDISCVRYGEIYGKYNNSFIDCISATKLAIQKSPRYFEKGDILCAGTGELVEEIGKSIVYVGDDRCLAGGDIIIIKHKQNPIFLNYALNSRYAQAQKSCNKSKLKVVHISASDIGNVILIMPPLAEQQKIAEYLDEKCNGIDQLISIKQQKIVELKDYKKSLIYEYTTGKKEVKL